MGGPCGRGDPMFPRVFRDMGFRGWIDSSAAGAAYVFLHVDGGTRADVL